MRFAGSPEGLGVGDGSETVNLTMTRGVASEGMQAQQQTREGCKGTGEPSTRIHETKARGGSGGMFPASAAWSVTRTSGGHGLG